MARTKILCTIGPASSSKELMRAMIRSGMSAARINFSHGDHSEHGENIRNARLAAEEEGAVLPIVGDLQGPKLRIGSLQRGKELVHTGEKFVFTTRDVPGDGTEVHLPHLELVRAAKPGQRLLVDDGLLEFEVIDVTATDLQCVVLNGGPLGSHKGISAPGAPLPIPSLSDKDREDVEFAVKERLDFLALSFVKKKADVDQLRNLLASLGASIPIVAKIETLEALDSLDEILDSSDAVMVARGDLGVEALPERVPFVQKDIIQRCNRRGTPVITATQMLNSMVTNPRPTRAEASDVANAIVDGTSAVMLSGETASGEFPLASVVMMERISRYAEGKIPYDQWITSARSAKAGGFDDAISQATVEMAYELNAKGIVTYTNSGRTARLVASYRPKTPVIAITTRREIQRQLGLTWGVSPTLVPVFDTTDQMVQFANEAASHSGLARPGDTIIITAGIPPGEGHKTNMVKIHAVQ